MPQSSECLNGDIDPPSLWILSPYRYSPLDCFSLRSHYSSPARANICFSLLSLPYLGFSPQRLCNRQEHGHVQIHIIGNAFPSFHYPPLPLVKEPAKTFMKERSTTIIYAVLISNGNANALCKAINATSLSKIFVIDGAGAKTEVCNAAKIARQTPELASTLIKLNQDWTKYLLTARYAVNVTSGYAGGTDLTNLCKWIEVDVINNLFDGYKDDRKVG